MTTEFMLADPLLAFVDCMVEATSTEKFLLWERHAAESVSRPADEPAVPWVDHGLEFIRQVGELADHPVMVRFTFAIVGGAVLCFFSSDSRFVDLNMVRAWADSICRTSTNALNFHNRPQPEEPTENAIRFRAEDEILRMRMREARKQKTS